MMVPRFLSSDLQIVATADSMAPVYGGVFNPNSNPNPNPNPNPNLTQRLAEIDQLGRVGCMQPSAVRAQLSFERWQDAQVIAGVRDVAASPDRLVFNSTVPLPVTLALPLTLTTDH